MGFSYQTQSILDCIKGIPLAKEMSSILMSSSDRVKRPHIKKD